MYWKNFEIFRNSIIPSPEKVKEVFFTRTNAV